MAILAAIQAIQDLMIAVTGIKSAPDYPGPGIMPIAIAHLSSGEVTPGNPTGARTELNNIVVEVHVPSSGSISAAFATLEGIHPLVIAALTSDVTFGGTLQTYGWISFSTANSGLDGVNTVARAYTLNGCKVIA
jgi:hypothetical protein